MVERMVSTTYRRKINCRMDHCAKCDTNRYFAFVSHSGMIGKLPRMPAGMPPPSRATMFFRKQREGSAASQPLDAICRTNEW